MHNIENKSNKFYVYIFSKQKEVYIGDEECLITFLVRHTSTSWGCVTNNCFNNLNVTGKDIVLHYEREKRVTLDEFDEEIVNYVTKKIVIPKEYMFYDGYGRIVDVRVYRKKVFEAYNNIPDKPYYQIKRKDNREVGETYVCYKSWKGHTVYYKYRRGPVPGTGIIRGSYKKGFRKPKINSIRKQVSDPEVKDYIRKKSLPKLNGWWDDYPWRDNEKSWKSQTKCRHQWQKNQR